VIEIHPKNFLHFVTESSLDVLVQKYPMSQMKFSHFQNRQSDYRWVTAHLENVGELEWYILWRFVCL